MEQNKTITAQNKAFANMMSQMRDKYRKKLETLMLLFLFGKKNKPDEDFLFHSSIAMSFKPLNNKIKIEITKKLSLFVNIYKKLLR